MTSLKTTPALNSSGIEARCAATGMRMTEQRRVIARVLAEACDHPDVEELYRRCVAVDDKISISTVYRTVKLFEDAGIIERHDFREGRARYEQMRDSHHDHLINLRDGKVIAQKLLSCAYRTGQRFGAMHLIDVLVGRQTERVKQFGHDQLSVFGIGRELNEKQWRAALRQLVAMGHLAPDTEAYGALKFTETSRAVLKGELPVMLREETASAARAIRSKSRRGDLAPRPAAAGDGNLLASLRAWRSDIARNRGVPAYVVLHDATIDGIASARPTTLGQLRDIPGIGDKKLEHYGAELLALIKAATG